MGQTIKVDSREMESLYEDLCKVVNDASMEEYKKILNDDRSWINKSENGRVDGTDNMTLSVWGIEKLLEEKRKKTKLLDLINESLGIDKIKNARSEQLNKILDRMKP